VAKQPKRPAARIHSLAPQRTTQAHFAHPRRMSGA
jgi:hypothetical protein